MWKEKEEKEKLVVRSVCPVVDIWEDIPPVISKSLPEGFGREEYSEVIQYSERYPYFEKKLRDLECKEEIDDQEEYLPPTKDL